MSVRRSLPATFRPGTEHPTRCHNEHSGPPDDASTYADLLARLGNDGAKELFRRLLEQALRDLVDPAVPSTVSGLFSFLVARRPALRSDSREKVNGG
jgi:hypothetical protein